MGGERGGLKRSISCFLQLIPVLVLLFAKETSRGHAQLLFFGESGGDKEISLGSCYAGSLGANVGTLAVRFEGFGSQRQ